MNPHARYPVDRYAPAKKSPRYDNCQKLAKLYQKLSINHFVMITKEKVIEKIDRLSDVELEKVYLYLSSLSMGKKEKANIRSLKLNGKLDSKDIRSIAYE